MEIKAITTGEVTFKFKWEEVGDKDDLVSEQEMYSRFKIGIAEHLEEVIGGIEVTKLFIRRNLEEVK